MKTIDPQATAEKYDEINRLETRGERIELLNKQTEEMRIALWLENVSRKTENLQLSAEQKDIIEAVKEKYFTVEFFKSARGRDEADAGPEYHEIMGRASRLLGREMMGELFGIMGDSKTMKC